MPYKIYKLEDYRGKIVKMIFLDEYGFTVHATVYANQIMVDHGKLQDYYVELDEIDFELGIYNKELKYIFSTMTYLYHEDGKYNSNVTVSNSSHISMKTSKEKIKELFDYLKEKIDFNN